MHIAHISYVDFYESAFSSRAEYEKLISAVEATPRDQSKAKLAMHQAARMIWLADRIDDFARKRPALQLLFYMIAAEAVAKIVVGFEGEGQSRKHVRIFFEDICDAKHKSILSKAFSKVEAGYLSIEETIDLLYIIRCDVVHEGRYFSFSLPESVNDYPEITTVGQEAITAHITLNEIRQIVIEGALLGVQTLLLK